MVEVVAGIRKEEVDTPDRGTACAKAQRQAAP
jgi:hypothetical protein